MKIKTLIALMLDATVAHYANAKNPPTMANITRLELLMIHLSGDNYVNPSLLLAVQEWRVA